MSRSRLYPLVAVVITLVILVFIFVASRPEPLAEGAETGVVGSVAEDPGMIGVAEGGGEDE